MYRIKAVLDTNIIVSGIVSPKGSPRKLLELAKEDTFKVVTSILINREIIFSLVTPAHYGKNAATRQALAGLRITTKNNIMVSRQKVLH